MLCRKRAERRKELTLDEDAESFLRPTMVGGTTRTMLTMAGSISESELCEADAQKRCRRIGHAQVI